MKYYQELTILPDAEVSANQIWSKVYHQLHIALADQINDGEKGRIGVSFPECVNEGRITLGNKLRVFAEEEKELAKMDIKRWLRRYQDYVHVTQIRLVPNRLRGYAIYRRYHPKANYSQKARRYAKRHSIDYDEAIKLFPMENKKIDLPYVQMSSETNSQKFRLYVEKVLCNSEVDKGFGSYGLDNKSTVPEF
ncbi:type I-F CRISPR-associated endoribonuclease Cas6/Csy4 [Selenomonas ruminis]|uniref:Type I-F CRISPR-associated endoribonuclease Cas6/Csy4 n=1 Tax=Selenomonas ruminis TaxID=2593411 RepID=A0A5D6W4V6_9FIRM|nr:type I-F CRISPR-associated endoribonuclease Cas6/Csy4 [Selenomonas sp. mPRGC5]TYZ22947.1 type I-F CRISPR-associated endoribonuclease Cas6/Csy4 [Selenomonas sp. mPRGC5]